MRIALAALAVVAALASVETVRGGNVPRQRHLQRRSPKPPLKLKPFKLGKLLGLLENAQEQGDELLAPPTLLQNLIGEDGDEVTMPLDKLKDKLGGVGGGQLLDPISMFIPPIGQGRSRRQSVDYSLFLGSEVRDKGTMFGPTGIIVTILRSKQFLNLRNCQSIEL